MTLKQGEVYRCPDAQCGCEITVTHSANPDCRENQKPRCCCGKEMVKQWQFRAEAKNGLRPAQSLVNDGPEIESD
jgi:hypothetical protein